MAKVIRTKYTEAMLVLIGIILILNGLGVLKRFLGLIVAYYRSIGGIYTQIWSSNNILAPLNPYFIITLIEFIFLLILFIKLYKLKSNVFLFLHLAFVTTFIGSILKIYILIQSSLSSAIDIEILYVPVLIFKIILIIVLWITFYIHLKNSQKNQSMVFS